MTSQKSPLEEVLEEVKTRNKAAANIPSEVLPDNEGILRMIVFFYLKQYLADPGDLGAFMSQPLHDLYRGVFEAFLRNEKNPESRQYCAELGKHITGRELCGIITSYIDGSGDQVGRLFLRQYLSHAISQIYKPSKNISENPEKT